MLRLKKLVVHRFRDAVPGTTLEFADGVNAIIGLNGTGKTTLLDLLAAVARTDLSAYRDQELDLEVWLERGPEDERPGILLQYRFTAVREGHLRSRSSEGHEGVDRRLPLLPRLSVKTWDLLGDERLVLVVERDGEVFVGGQSVARFDRLYSYDAFEDLLLALVVPAAAEGEGFPCSSDLTMPAVVGRLDEGLDAFRSVVDGVAALPGVGRQEFTYFPDSEDPLFFASAQFFIPHGVIEALKEAPDPGHGVVVTASAFGAPQLPEAIGAEEVELRLSPESDMGTGDMRHLDFKSSDLWARWSSTSQSKHTTWSFGQKRMAAFCYYAACAPKGVIFADELTNGLHHHMVEIAVEIIGERQAILATQNPLLLDHMAFESADHMRRSFVLCELKKGPRGERQWIWRNPTEDEAESFFRAYQVDVSHVSEILRSKGLW